MKNAASYIYSTYSFISDLSLDQLLKVGNSSKCGLPIPSFDESLLVDLCSEAREIFENESNVLNITGDTFIVGDIHGSFHDLLRVIKYTLNDHSKVLFLGDYVDRGYFSLECITILFALKVMNPKSIFLIRGNHEFDSICSYYGFKEEILNYHNPKKTKEVVSNKVEKNINNDEIDFDLVEESTANEIVSDEDPCDEYFANRIDSNCYKYSEKLYNAFIKAFSYLPIAAIVNKSTFCIHGGICPSLDKVEKLHEIVRPINDFDESSLLTEVIWSDPSNNEEGWFRENQRGRGHSFNGAAAVNFLKKNSFERIIRAHQCVKSGTQEYFNQKCITVFTASSYCKPGSNKSGLLQLFQNNNIEYYNFDPLFRLKKVDALYYKVQSLDEKEKQQPRCFTTNPARINMKCTLQSISNLKLVPNSIEKKINRSRISHYNSLNQSDINFDIWKTPNPKKTSSIPTTMARIISRPAIVNRQAKRKTHSNIQALNFAQKIKASILNNEMMSRSASIPEYFELTDNFSKDDNQDES